MKLAVHAGLWWLSLSQLISNKEHLHGPFLFRWLIHSFERGSDCL